MMRHGRGGSSRHVAPAKQVIRAEHLALGFPRDREASRELFLLRRNDSHHPVLVGDAKPAARAVKLDLRLLRVAHVRVRVLLQQARQNTEHAFVQGPLLGVRESAFPRGYRIGKQRDGRARVVLHAVVDREHVILVDRDATREDLSLPVVPRQHERRFRRQRIAGCRPDGRGIRNAGLGPWRGRPACLGIRRRRRSLRRQEDDFIAVRVQLHAIFLEPQVVDLCARQPDRTVNLAVLEGNACPARGQRSFTRLQLGRNRSSRTSWRDRTRCRWCGSVSRLLGARSLRSQTLALGHRRDEEEVPQQQHPRAEHERCHVVAGAGPVAVVHSCLPDAVLCEWECADEWQVSGTGSYPELPPSHEIGWHFESRRSVSQPPLRAPCFSMASSA